jgi:hypothetical protein
MAAAANEKAWPFGNGLLGVEVGQGLGALACEQCENGETEGAAVSITALMVLPVIAVCSGDTTPIA